MEMQHQIVPVLTDSSMHPFDNPDNMDQHAIEYPRNHRSGNRAETLAAYRSKNARADALRCNRPREQDKRTSPALSEATSRAGSSTQESI